MSIPVNIVVAVADNGVIGAGDQMPWRLPSDLRRFRRLTMGTPMVMGRKTYESIGKSLPGRTSIVVTRDKNWRGDGAVVVNDTRHALELAREIARAQAAPAVSIVGGGEIYRQLMGEADRLHVTHVHCEPEGDVLFDSPSPDIWRLQSQEAVESGESDSATSTYCVYERR